MKELSQNEPLIEGKWEFDGSSMNADEACKRTEWLTENKLLEPAVNGDRWESLYQDPNDDRFRILTYPKSNAWRWPTNAITNFRRKSTCNHEYRITSASSLLPSVAGNSPEARPHTSLTLNPKVYLK